MPEAQSPGVSGGPVVDGRNKDDLRRRLLLASAQLYIEEIEPREAVMLACDLLAGGAFGEATFELAMQSPARHTQNHTKMLLGEILAEWKADTPGQLESAEIVALDLCHRLLAGTLEPEHAGHRLLGALAQGADRVRTDRLLRLLDRLEYNLAGRADGALRAELEALARDIVRSDTQP